ncbi:hypothetical protein AAG570_004847 [Ranatra chinensis]|uniref:Uncharacterized protein n=1 Tax=Ranatra chinensis TaxID=642074 RepID=A0ABD0XYP5_9HEMI
MVLTPATFHVLVPASCALPLDCLHSSIEFRSFNRCLTGNVPNVPPLPLLQFFSCRRTHSIHIPHSWSRPHIDVTILHNTFPIFPLPYPRSSPGHPKPPQYNNIRQRAYSSTSTSDDNLILYTFHVLERGHTPVFSRRERSRE